MDFTKVYYLIKHILQSHITTANHYGVYSEFIYHKLS